MVRISRIKYQSKLKHIAWRRKLMKHAKFMLREMQLKLDCNPLNSSARKMYDCCAKILARQRDYKVL